jgi:polysaccharide export outer membrane protein
MKHKLAFLLLLTLIVVSCIPNRKIAYLQHGEEYREPETIVKDTLVRKYDNGDFEYRLRTGDLLDVKISPMTPLVDNPFADADRNLIPGQQYTQTYDPNRNVQPTGYYLERDGYVNLPIIGNIKLEGYTIEQAEDTLETYVARYLENPVVRLKLQNFKFSVIGEVQNDATITSGDLYITMLQAIGMAGGVSEFGDLSRIKVIRHYGTESYVFYVNLLSEEFLTSPFYFVHPDDVIVVTPLKPRPYLKYAAPNLTILTSTVSLLIGVITLFKLAR